MKTPALIHVMRINGKHNVMITIDHVRIYTHSAMNHYTRRSSAIRGAVRALKRIGYKGEYEISII